MSRKPRIIQDGYCYHITVRCNNREFRLPKFICKQILLFCLQKCIQEFEFKLYGLCIMSNHVHYLLEPKQPEGLPKIMHWLNWYTAMCFNRILNRTGHFWEKRYHSTGFPVTDKRRALNTLRYIHANPKAANMQQGFFYDFSNYGSYDRLTYDGISEWHPAFLLLGKTLEMCAAAYRKFCQNYRPKPKPEKKNYWGRNLLANVKGKINVKKKSPGQQNLWDEWTLPLDDIEAVSQKFVLANCFNPEIALMQFADFRTGIPDWGANLGANTS